MCSVFGFASLLGRSVLFGVVLLFGADCGVVWVEMEDLEVVVEGCIVDADASEEELWEEGWRSMV